jgi:hypothetical protein
MTPISQAEGSVMTRYAATMARKTASSLSEFWLLSRTSAAASSVTAKPAAIEVFFARAIQTLPSGGTTVRNACGSTMVVRVCRKSRPSARAASACPGGTELMPERSASETNAAVYSDRAATAVMKREGNCRSISTMPNARKKKTTVSGVLRKTST